MKEGRRERIGSRSLYTCSVNEKNKAMSANTG
jgi:hypothetical protein